MLNYAYEKFCAYNRFIQRVSVLPLLRYGIFCEVNRAKADKKVYGAVYPRVNRFLIANF